MKFSPEQIADYQAALQEVEAAGLEVNLEEGQVIEKPGLYLLSGLVKLYSGGVDVMFFESDSLLFCPPDFGGIFQTLSVQTVKYLDANKASVPFITSYYSSYLSLTRFSPAFIEHQSITVAAGKEIIAEGSSGTEVFIMLSGSADVLVGGSKVGEVLEDEIFGAVSALTGARRNAAVVTTSECCLLEFGQEQFSELVRHRPEIATKLINDLARALGSTNLEVIAQQRVMRSLAT